LNRCEAVEVLKEILETGYIHCPMYSLDAIKDSTNYKVSIRVNDKDKPTLKEIVSFYRLMVNEEMDTIVIS
jgi:hypothetical protein